MGQMPVYQYTIPLEQTEDGSAPAYDYPEGPVISKFETGGHLIVVQDKVVPHFHKNSVAVKVDVLVEHEFETDAEMS